MARLFSFRKWFDRFLGPAPRSGRKSLNIKRLRLRLEELENRLAPATALSIADASVLEPAPGGTANMEFSVTRTGDLTAPLTVGYTTSAGTAQANTDFTPKTGSTTFAAGSATAAIDIPVFGNGVYNPASLAFSVQLTGVGPPVTLAGRQVFATGNNPVSVAVNDINGDGKPDLAVANVFDNTVSVLLNTTAAGETASSFASQQTFATGLYPSAVALADVNGDGKPDLVVANFGDGTASVLLNTTAAGAATPSFTAQQSFAAGLSPSALAVGDFNGDGKPDLVLANYDDGTISVLLNTTPQGAAAASFALRNTFATGRAPKAVAVADVNGDGKPDIVVANFIDNTVTVLLNTTPQGAATPSFAAPRTFATGRGPTALAAADINGDGKPDLVVANQGDNSLSVLLNTTPPLAASAAFANQQVLSTGTLPVSVAAADVNGDGRPDLVVANESDNTVTVFPNTTAAGASTASFATSQVFAAGGFPFAVALRDVNSDGQPDLIVADRADASVAVLLNAPGTITRSTATGTITESDPAPTVSFASAAQTVNENAGAFSATVNLSAASSVATTVPFTLGGTAAAGTNYSGVTTSPLVIPAGHTSGTITGNLIDDGKFDTANKTLILTLGTPTNATLGSTTADTLTLQESDPAPTVSFAAAAQAVNENAGAFSVTVNLSATSNVATTIPFTLGGTAASGTNYSGVAASPLVIAAGQTSGTITGNLIDDGKFDAANKTLILTLGTPTNAILGSTTADTLAIQESDPAPTVSFASATQSVNENAGIFSAVVNLSAASNVATAIPFTIGGSAVSGVNYSGATASPLVIPAGQTSGTITGNLIDDGKYDTVNKTLILTLGTPTNASLGSTTADTLTSQESDPTPTVTFASATQSVNENAGTFAAVVNLSAASNVATTIPFTIGGSAVSGTNYSGVTASPLVIPAGQTSGAITGNLIDDGNFDPVNKTLTLTLGTPTGATLANTTVDTLTIIETDPARTVSFASAAQTVNASAGAFSATVNLSSASSTAVTVPFTLGGSAVAGSDYTSVTTSPLVIAAGQTTGAITGTLLSNPGPNSTRTLTFTLGTPSGAGLGGTTTFTLTIVQPLLIGDQTLSYHQNSFTVNLDPGSTYAVSSAGSMAFFLKRDLGLKAAASFYLNAAGLNEKWFLGNRNAFGNSWYFIKPSGQLFQWDGTPAALGSTMVGTLDPVYCSYPDLLTQATTSTLDFVLKQRLGLIATSNFYQNYGGQNEKWLTGNPNLFGNSWYFIDPAGRFFAWNGTANQAAGTLLATLDTLYWAQPSRLFSAQANEVTAAIVSSVLQVTTRANWAGRVVVELNTTAPAANHQIFTLNFVNHAPVLTPIGNQSTKKNTPLTVTLAASDVDGDAVTFSALGGHLGYLLGQTLGLRLQGSLSLNYGGQQEEWLQSAAGNWYFIKPSGNLYLWDGTPKQATGSLVNALDPIYYYHPDLLYNAPAGDLAYALDQRLGLAGQSANYSLNYGGQNEKWLLGAGGWYFIKPDGTFWKWDAAANKATGILMATLDPDYYANIQRLANAQPNQVALGIAGNKLTLTPAAGFLGQFWVLVTAGDGSQAVTGMFTLSVTP